MNNPAFSLPLFLGGRTAHSAPAIVLSQAAMQHGLFDDRLPIRTTWIVVRPLQAERDRRADNDSSSCADSWMLLACCAATKKQCSSENSGFHSSPCSLSYRRNRAELNPFLSAELVARTQPRRASSNNRTAAKVTYE